MCPPMPAEITSLRTGDIVAIKYRLARYSVRGVCYVEPWIIGAIVNCGDEGWPIVRLDDGQVTELRPFVSWRLVTRAEADGADDLAA